jgi:hypothetical protein
MLFRARWNVPKASLNAGIPEEECKRAFQFYCETHPTTYRSEVYEQMRLL